MARRPLLDAYRRTVYVAFTPCRRHVGLFACLLTSLLTLGACERSGSTAVETLAVGESQDLLSQVRLAAVGGRPGQAKDESPVQFPRDLQPHADAAAESLELRSVLVAEDGTQMALQVRLDRLALARAKGSSSQWEYTDVMRSRQIVGMAGEAGQRQEQSLQRRALGLADSDADTIFVTATRLRVHTDANQLAGVEIGDSCLASMEVSVILPEPLSVDPVSGFQSAALAARGAAMADGQNSHRMELELSLDHCPDVSELEDFRQWRSDAMPVIARLTRHDASSGKAVGFDAPLSNWRGLAWMSNSWGVIPATGGAVLIDSAVLYLGDMLGSNKADRQLSISRSKRRSGRGPVTVQASLSHTGGLPQSVELQWLDVGGESNGEGDPWVPSSFTVSNADKSINLELKPLVPPAALRDVSGFRWSGAVRFSGSHTGIGFVDFQLPEPQAQAQEGTDK